MTGFMAIGAVVGSFAFVFDLKASGGRWYELLIGACLGCVAGASIMGAAYYILGKL